MFINVVITRVILFCPAVPPSPPSAPSLVPRNATSFVSLLAKLLVLRTLLSLPMRKVERESQSVPSRECSFLFMSSRPSSLSFFLLLSLFPSSRSAPLCSPSRSAISLPSFLFLALCRAPSSRALRGVIAHGSLSSGLTHFPPLLLGGEALLLLLLFVLLLVVLVFRVVLFLFFHSSSYSPAGGSFSTRVRAGVSLPFMATTTAASRQPPPPSSPATTSRCSLLLPFPSSFFVPVDRGVLHSSNLNAGRAGVLYRLRK